MILNINMSKIKAIENAIGLDKNLIFKIGYFLFLCPGINLSVNLAT
jgi:hypothetical protein